jgi:hypothetical protein
MATTLTPDIVAAVREVLLDLDEDPDCDPTLSRHIRDLIAAIDDQAAAHFLSEDLPRAQEAVDRAAEGFLTDRPTDRTTETRLILEGAEDILEGVHGTLCTLYRELPDWSLFCSVVSAMLTVLHRLEDSPVFLRTGLAVSREDLT